MMGMGMGMMGMMPTMGMGMGMETMEHGDIRHDTADSTHLGDVKNGKRFDFKNRDRKTGN
jgi:hypothetical protein